MTQVTYEIVEHDGGWAYRVGDVYSETFPSHDAALKAARSAAERQRAPGETRDIEYQTADGVWREETGNARDRPVTGVLDEPRATDRRDA